MGLGFRVARAPHRHGDDGVVGAVDGGELGVLATRVPGLERDRLRGAEPVSNCAAIHLAADAQPGSAACRCNTAAASRTHTVC